MKSKKMPLIGYLLFLGSMGLACNTLSGNGAPPTIEFVPPTIERKVTLEVTQIPPTVSPSITPSEPQPVDTQPPPTNENHNPLPHLSPGENIVISKIAMKTNTSGWAIGGDSDPGEHILYTQDAGQSWRDISPPEPVSDDPFEHKIAKGFFLDANTAWVLYTYEDFFIRPLAQSVWITQNSGQTWEPVGEIKLQGLDEYFLPEQIFFADELNGWVLVNVGAGMSHVYVNLFRTQDGGHTWDLILDPSGTNDMQLCPKTGLVFADGFTGWVTRDCRGLMDGAHVLGTGNGGDLWNFFEIPPPPSEPEAFNYPQGCGTHSPQFSAPTKGVLTVHCVRYENDNKIETSYVYSSLDSGFSWQSSPYPGGDLLVLNANTAFAFGRDIYRSTDSGDSWQLIKTVNWDGDFSFVNPEDGWAVARDGGEIALVRTINGGQKWELLDPIIIN